MKKLLVILVAALALAGCGEKPRSEATPVPAPDPEATADLPASPVDPVAVLSGKPLPHALAQGVSFSFPYHFLARKIVEVAPGRYQDRLTIEFLDNDVETVTEQLIGDMAKSGFRVSKNDLAEDGRRLLVFSKKGFGGVRINVAPIGARKLRHAEADGTVYMVWPSDGLDAAGPPAGG